MNEIAQRERVAKAIGAVLSRNSKGECLLCSTPEQDMEIAQAAIAAMHGSSPQVGDIVQLISGGPAMAVNSIQNGRDDVISCEWFADTDLKRDAFDAANLVPFKGEK